MVQFIFRSLGILLFFFCEIGFSIEDHCNPNFAVGVDMTCSTPGCKYIYAMKATKVIPVDRIPLIVDYSSLEGSCATGQAIRITGIHQNGVYYSSGADPGFNANSLNIFPQVAGLNYFSSPNDQVGSYDSIQKEFTTLDVQVNSSKTKNSTQDSTQDAIVSSKQRIYFPSQSQAGSVYVANFQAFPIVSNARQLKSDGTITIEYLKFFTAIPPYCVYPAGSTLPSDRYSPGSELITYSNEKPRPPQTCLNVQFISTCPQVLLPQANPPGAWTGATPLLPSCQDGCSRDQSRLIHGEVGRFYKSKVHSNCNDLGPTGQAKDLTCGSPEFDADKNYIYSTCTAPINCNADSINPLNWGNCVAPVPNSQMINSGSNFSLVDSVFPSTGTRNFQCQNGLWVPLGQGVCQSQVDCDSSQITNLSWGSGCMATAPTSQIFSPGLSHTIVDSGLPSIGNRSFTCNSDGSWSPIDSGQCELKQADCSTNTISDLQWGNCLGVFSGAQTIKSGETFQLEDHIGPFLGSKTFRCVDGTWSELNSGVCSTTVCSASNLNWGPGLQSCFASVGAVNGGELSPLLDSQTSQNHNGQAQFKCEINGEWNLNPISSSCTPLQCDANILPLEWTVGSNVCYQNGPISGLKKINEEITLQDAAVGLDGLTGSMTYVCENQSGVPRWVEKPGAKSCNSVPKCPVRLSTNWTQGGFTCVSDLAATIEGQNYLAISSQSTRGQATYQCVAGAMPNWNMNPIAATCDHVCGVNAKISGGAPRLTTPNLSVEMCDFGLVPENSGSTARIFSWNCDGYLCDVDRLASCGEDSNLQKYFLTAPNTEKMCSGGDVANVIQVAGQWSWQCVGNVNSQNNCAASLLTCGSAHRGNGGLPLAGPPQSGLCSDPNLLPSVTTTNDSFSWSCGDQVLCIADRINCPAVTSVTWTDLGNSCQGDLPQTPAGLAANANDNNGPMRGSVSVTCPADGLWPIQTNQLTTNLLASCTADPICPSRSNQTWSVNNGNGERICAADLSVSNASTLQSVQTSPLSMTKGEATFYCNQQATWEGSPSTTMSVPPAIADPKCFGNCVPSSAQAQWVAERCRYTKKCEHGRLLETKLDSAGKLIGTNWKNNRVLEHGVSEVVNQNDLQLPSGNILNSTFQFFPETFEKNFLVTCSDQQLPAENIIWGNCGVVETVSNTNASLCGCPASNANAGALAMNCELEVKCQNGVLLPRTAWEPGEADAMTWAGPVLPIDLNSHFQIQRSHVNLGAEYSWVSPQTGASTIHQIKCGLGGNIDYTSFIKGSCKIRKTVSNDTLGCQTGCWKWRKVKSELKLGSLPAEVNCSGGGSISTPTLTCDSSKSGQIHFCTEGSFDAEEYTFACENTCSQSPGPCASANGQISNSMPSSNLCQNSNYVPYQWSDSANWYWSCDSTCFAPKASVVGCGSSHLSNSDSPPATNTLCSDSSVPVVNSLTDRFEWVCGGTELCYQNKLGCWSRTSIDEGCDQLLIEPQINPNSPCVVGSTGIKPRQPSDCANQLTGFVYGYQCFSRTSNSTCLPGSPYFGGSGGTVKGPLTCAGSGKVLGINVRSGAYIDRLSFICENGTDLDLGGGSGGGIGSFQCPAGKYVTGISGRSGKFIDQLSVICSNVDEVNSGAMNGTTFGGNGGNSFSYKCPPKMFVKTIQGRSGAYIDQLKVICGDL